MKSTNTQLRKKKQFWNPLAQGYKMPLELKKRVPTLIYRDEDPVFESGALGPDLWEIFQKPFNKIYR